MSGAAYETFIPTLSGKALSPNSRMHWRRGVDATRELRTFVGTLILADVRQKKWPGLPFKRAKIAFEYRVCRRRLGDDGRARPRDPDNAQAALKPALDGIVDAGVLAGDTAEHVESVVTTLAEVETRADEGIGIVVEEVE